MNKKPLFNNDSVELNENVNKEKPILKQHNELRNSDFEAFPVWVGCHCLDYDEDWYDDTDEETFRPWNDKVPSDEEQWMFLVKADFILADGTALRGFMSPPEHGNEFDMSDQHPIIITENGELIAFWYGSLPDNYFKKDTALTYSLLNKKHEEIFPIQCTILREMIDGQNTGLILGFERNEYKGRHKLWQ